MTDQRNSEGAIFAAASFGLIRVIRVNLWLIFPEESGAHAVVADPRATLGTGRA